MPKVQGEQARDLHGQRLQCRVASGSSKARLAKPQYHAEGRGTMETQRPTTWRIIP